MFRVLNGILEWMGLRDKPRKRSGLKILAGSLYQGRTYTHMHDGSTHTHGATGQILPVAPIRPDTQNFLWKEKTEKRRMREDEKCLMV